MIAALIVAGTGRRVFGEPFTVRSALEAFKPQALPANSTACNLLQADARGARQPPARGITPAVQFPLSGTPAPLAAGSFLIDTAYLLWLTAILWWLTIIDTVVRR